MLICEKNKRDTVAFVKGIVHQKITIESSFTHLHAVSNLFQMNTKGDILKNVLLRLFMQLH